ncbi:MAG TPA: TfoX/Sxy family protein [Streptosporangiaceae bacterium]|jgi:TfoX/Sxy family transcriptional regulator of competence genes|nr:TfoX/Sxy family protein [Streptosporangiaceae bacterium]
MQIPKPTDSDKEFFRSVLPDDPEIEIKPMFGNLGAFVHGNMFAGLFGADVGVRLDDAGRTELEAADGSGPFGPQERPMGGYLSLPRAWRASPEVAATWIERARAHVATLPPKQKRATAKRNQSPRKPGA